MTGRRIDPAPRAYPATVTLKARSARGPGCAPDASSAADIEDWLLSAATREASLLHLFEALCWGLARIMPFERASLHVGTLHPQLLGFAWNFEQADGLCDEVRVAAEALLSDSYKRSPLVRAIEHGEGVALDVANAATRAQYPLLDELNRRGYSDYRTLPLPATGGLHNVATAATKAAGGFSDAEIKALKRILGLFSLHVQRLSASRIAGTLMDVYLGAEAGGRVFAGTIARGSGAAIHAVIWSSDLRGFTDLSDRLAPEAMITLLNAYFGEMAGAVLEAGGEVLKFIGDGLLAVFPLERDYAAGNAAEAALAAARDAMTRIVRLSEDPPPALVGIEGWRPLRSGIGLHEGEVFFGNVGAPERLDFTVIGRSVNVAARIEGLTKALGAPVLISEPVARRLSAPLDNLGEHALRGVSETLRLFAPSATQAS